VSVLIDMPTLADSGWFWQNPLLQGNSLQATVTVDTNVMVAVGGYGTILRTTDGGATWSVQASGTTDVLYGVSFADTETGTAVGDGGTIVRTTTGGERPSAKQSQ
jgi:photosystem II stability/assembly factor-like uncharacterized protein